MALTIATEILGQQATSSITYNYLYEPLRISITESDLTAKKIYVDLILRSTSDTATVLSTGTTLVNYGDYDLNPGQSLSIDLMKLVQQHHNANVYNFSHIDEIVSDGWKSVVSEYIYEFSITSDITTTPISIKKLPIIGGRSFPDFVPAISTFGTQLIDEADINGVGLHGRFKDYPYLNTILANLASASTNKEPSIFKGSSTTQGITPCAGQVIWKSRFGGWMTWGFKLKTESQAKKYSGNIQVGMFESTLTSGGQAYIPVDYTGISTSYDLKLKELALESDELRAVQGIIASPAVYYMKDSTGALELMRLSSASAPLDNKANGGDFSVSLKSISTSMQKTR